MTNINVKIHKLHPDAVIPKYATDGSAGFDLVAVEDVIIEPGETKKVPLGLAFEIPQGYYMAIVMRSGIALNTNLRQSNGYGVIDSDYRGEVAMLFDNTAPLTSLWGDPLTVNDEEIEYFSGDEYITRGGTYLIRKGDRIAQGIIVPVFRASFEETTELSETIRGDGGFGHTGTNTEVSG